MSQLCLCCGASSNDGDLQHRSDCPASPQNVIARLREEIEDLQTELAVWDGREAVMVKRDEELSGRIEELEKEFHQAVECPRCHLEFGPFSHIGIVGHIFTDEQIDAAWKHANTHVEIESKLVEYAFNELGIERCEVCDRMPGKQYEWGKGDELQPCANCNGHGWVKK